MDKKILAFSEPVDIVAAATNGDGAKGPPTFSVAAYKWGPVRVHGWDRPVVIDAEGLEFARSIVANLEHDESKPVGHVTKAEKTTEALMLDGVFSLDDEQSTKRILNGARNKFPWEASVEVSADVVEEVEAGESTEVNGQTFNGPLYVARKGTLYGFGFVLHGADKNTDVSIAASDAASHKENAMELEQGFKTWAEQMLPGVVIAELPKAAIENLQADYAGREGGRAPVAAAVKGGDRLEVKRAEANRRSEIKRLAEEWCDEAIKMERYDDIDSIRDARDNAIKAGTSVKDFQYELKLATLQLGPPVVHTPRQRGLSNAVLEAAICSAGKLKDAEKAGVHFDEQTLELAHDRFKGRLSLCEAYVEAAEANGYTGRIGNRVDEDLHNWAFGLAGDRRIRAGGFSTISLPNVFSNVANKFLRMGWDAVDQTFLRIAAVRPVSDFKQITTVSLTGGMQFQPVGPDGELKNGSVGEEVYNNQADTAGIIFSITRKDLRNDDLGALTAVPRRIGRGGMLYLNHIGWTEFLDPSVANFFHTSNSNVSTEDGTLGLTGLSQAETIFKLQTDPDGNPLLAEPKILLVPTALHTTARQLMTSEKIKGDADEPDNNIWQGRFRVESSPYLQNTSYTGASPVAWYLLADPSDLPVIEIAALDGNVQPTVETADAAFNVLGVQMRGYSDVGVKVQEPRGGVRADGSGA